MTQSTGPIVPILKQIDACCDATTSAPLMIPCSDAQTLRSYIRMLEREKLQSSRTQTTLRNTQRALLDALVVFDIDRNTRYWLAYAEVIAQAQAHWKAEP